MYGRVLLNGKSSAYIKSMKVQAKNIFHEKEDVDKFKKQKNIKNLIISFVIVYHGESEQEANRGFRDMLLEVICDETYERIFKKR